jgi:hypothetical protein
LAPGGLKKRLSEQLCQFANPSPKMGEFLCYNALNDSHENERSETYMKKMRWLTLIIVLVLLLPTQAALAYNYRGRTYPSIKITPFSITTPINSTVNYKVNIGNLPAGGLHCVKVSLVVPSGYKIYPGNGYSYYHFYTPAALDFKVKVPNTAQRKFIYATVSWSVDYACHSIRTTKKSSQVELIVTK